MASVVASSSLVMEQLASNVATSMFGMDLAALVSHVREKGTVPDLKKKKSKAAVGDGAVLCKHILLRGDSKGQCCGKKVVQDGLCATHAKATGKIPANAVKTQCTAITKSGSQCTKNAASGSSVCTQHEKVKANASKPAKASKKAAKEEDKKAAEHEDHDDDQEKLLSESEESDSSSEEEEEEEDTPKPAKSAKGGKGKSKK